MYHSKPATADSLVHWRKFARRSPACARLDGIGRISTQIRVRSAFPLELKGGVNVAVAPIREFPPRQAGLGWRERGGPTSRTHRIQDLREANVSFLF